MNIFKQLAIATALLLLVFYPGQAKANIAYSDITPSDEAYKEIHFLTDIGIIEGSKSTDGSQVFKPRNNITRAQASKMLIIATGNEDHNGDHVKLVDVSSPEQQFYIQKAVSLGYFKLNANGTFNPNEHVKRSELSTALAIAFDFKEPVTFIKPLHFNDVARSDAFAPHVNALYYAGVSQGDKGSFGPNKLLTRKHFALFVARAMDNQFKLSVTNPSPTIVGKGKVKVDNLNVRTSSSTKGKIVGKLNTGDTFDVIKVHENWMEIKYFNRPAFISMSKEYIELLDADSKPVGAASSLAKVKTGTDTLNVRTLPSTSGNVIGTLKNNDIVEVYGEKNGWLLILVNGLPGYINKSFTEKVVASTPPSNDGVTTGKLIGKVTVANLNVRSGTGTNHPIIDKLKRGQKVEVTALNGNWATININGKTGYVSKVFLKLLNQSNAPLKDRIIVIDAGHGGSDPGASANGIIEKNLTLDVSKRVEAKLKKAGAKVLMTRSGDTFPSLQDRTNYAKNNFAEVFVSIHGNSATPAANGTEVFYDNSGNPNGDESRALAQFIQNNIVKMADMNDRGVKNTGFYVLKNNNVASVLVELGFMTNKADAAKLSSDKYKEIYAEAIYQGLVQYYAAE